MKPAADITTMTQDITASTGLVTATDRASVALEAPSRLSDFYELTKPRMNFLVVITTMVGFCMASRGRIDWLLLLHAILGTALTAASSAMFNQVLERDADAKMPRTTNRPVAAGRVSVPEAAACGLALGIVGVSYLWLAVNPLTAMLGLCTLLLYIFIYTPLKRITSLNTVIGAVPGAIPPVMGFTAVNNAISMDALMLFGVLFLWQMPALPGDRDHVQARLPGRRVQDAAVRRSGASDHLEDDHALRRGAVAGESVAVAAGNDGRDLLLRCDGVRDGVYRRGHVVRPARASGARRAPSSSCRSSTCRCSWA